MGLCSLFRVACGISTQLATKQPKNDFKSQKYAVHNSWTQEAIARKRKGCVTYVLFICSGRQLALSVSSLLRRHFKTDPTETVTLCFGYPNTPCLQAEGKLSSRADEQAI
jgi:hypothetical protein